MAIKSDKSIYSMVEELLRRSDRPMTCKELMDNQEVRREAVDEWGGADKDVQLATNKLSDALGLMWRRGVLVRYPAPKDSLSFARYAYTLAEEDEKEVHAVPPPVKLKSKMLVGVSEHDDCVEIEFEKFIIYVKPKK